MRVARSLTVGALFWQQASRIHGYHQRPDLHGWRRYWILMATARRCRFSPAPAESSQTIIQLVWYHCCDHQSIHQLHRSAAHSRMAPRHPLSLVKQGTGSLTLGGLSTHSGPTTFNAGRLLGASGGGIANSGLTVANGATNGYVATVPDGQWSCARPDFTNAGTTYLTL